MLGGLGPGKKPQLVAWNATAPAATSQTAARRRPMEKRFAAELLLRLRGFFLRVMRAASVSFSTSNLLQV